MINPFVICSPEELALLQAYVDREKWELQCRSLGATLEQVRAYDASAHAYAQTTVYPNSDVVTYLRMLARNALARGVGFPASIEQALDAEQTYARSLAMGVV